MCVLGSLTVIGDCIQSFYYLVGTSPERAPSCSRNAHPAGMATVAIGQLANGQTMAIVFLLRASIGSKCGKTMLQNKQFLSEGVTNDHWLLLSWQLFHFSPLS